MNIIIFKKDIYERELVLYFIEKLKEAYKYIAEEFSDIYEKDEESWGVITDAERSDVDFLDRISEEVEALHMWPKTQKAFEKEDLEGMPMSADFLTYAGSIMHSIRTAFTKAGCDEIAGFDIETTIFERRFCKLYKNLIMMERFYTEAKYKKVFGNDRVFEALFGTVEGDFL